VLTVIRTAEWGLGCEEDSLQVEILGTATVKELKAKIEELYEVPQQLQRLALGREASTAAALEEASTCEGLLGQKVYMHPATMTDLMGSLPDMLQQAGLPAPPPEAQAALTRLTEAAQEAQQTNQALRESLEGVKYSVTFERPREAGGAAAGKRVVLQLDALAQLSVVQQLVEVELFGAAGKEPAFLLFGGLPLPSHASLFDLGIDDGKTVTVSKERPPHPAEQLLGLLSSSPAVAEQLAGGGLLLPGLLGLTGAGGPATSAS